MLTKAVFQIYKISKKLKMIFKTKKQISLITTNIIAIYNIIKHIGMFFEVAVASGIILTIVLLITKVIIRKAYCRSSQQCCIVEI